MTYPLLGYPTPLVARAGETVRFHLSRESGPETYTAQLVRVICGDRTPGGPGPREEIVATMPSRNIQVHRQPLFVGSFGVVQAPPEVFDAQPDFTVSCRFLATTPGRGAAQSVLARFDPASGRGWSLGIDPEGYLEARIGSGSFRIDQRILPHEWYHAALSYDAAAQAACLYLRPLRAFPAAHGRLSAGSTAGLSDCAGLPIVIAAQGGDLRTLARGEAAAHFNGKVETPCIFGRALPPEEIEGVAARGLPEATAPGLLAAWDLAQDIQDDRMVDCGLYGCHGRLMNLPTRGVTASGFDATAMGWPERPQHFAAVHFHDDDFEDARWEASLEIQLPTDLRSAIYALRLTSSCGNVVEHIVFFVAAPRKGTGRPVAFLASTLTYAIYSNMHSAIDMAEMEAKRGLWMTLGAPELFLNERRDLGLSPYDTHSDGSGVCYSSTRRPLFSMRLGERLWALNADTHITDWLEASGFDYDVITDDHLHREGPSVLAPYRAVITGTHPEYWTTRMLDSLESWLGAGGRLMYLGGNGFYWRTAIHPDKPWLAEVRRAESGARFWETAPGEAYHSFTGEYGGLWRRLGRAPQKYVGVGTVATGFDFSSYYRRRAEADDPRAGFIFDGISDEILGNFGLVGGGAAGSELDAADPRLGTPPHALVVASSEDHSRFVLLAPETMTSSIANHNGDENPDVKADIVFFETLAGGAVFSVGSIAWGGSLHHNKYRNNISQMTANVLKRFSDPTPFPPPPQAGPAGR